MYIVMYYTKWYNIIVLVIISCINLNLQRNYSIPMTNVCTNNELDT